MNLQEMAKRALSGLVAVAMVATTVLAQTDGEPGGLDEAKTKFQTGEFDAASNLLRALLEKDLPANTRRDANLYLGFSELELGHQEAAQAAMREVLRIAPDYRPDPAEFAPRLRAAFDEMRAQLQTGETSDIVSLLEPRGKLSHATKMPSMFARKWYQKWWVYAVVGAVGVGATALLVGGGNSYDPPAAMLDPLTQPCRDPNAPTRYQRGPIQVEAQVTDGEAPYTLRFFDDNVLVDTRNAPGTAPVQFTFPNVESAAGGGCRNHVLKVSVNDARDNEGRLVEASAALTVCQCFLPP